MDTDTLKAFTTLLEEKSFTKASQKLGLTQSALSQKLARLEDYLQATLVIRGQKEILPTSAGNKFFHFAIEMIQQENEFLKSFLQNEKGLSGTFRIAGFSSILRSLIIPKLSKFMRENENVNIQFSCHEMSSMVDLLKNNNTDLILTDFFPEIPGFEEVQVGSEEYVLIESKKHDKSPDIFLDHGPNDNATDSFFKFQGLKFNLKRGFMGDVYGILDGVAQGLGKAVMSKHLVQNDTRFKIIKSSKRYIRPLVMSYFRQNYYPPLHKNVFSILQDKLN